MIADDLPDADAECWLFGGPGEPSDWCGEHGASADQTDPRDPEMVVCLVRLQRLEAP